MGLSAKFFIMPPKAVQKSKAAKMAAAMAGSKKGKKKKWSKGKMAEKKENMSIFVKDEDGGCDTYEKIKKEVPRQKKITIASLQEKYLIKGSVARKVLAELEEKKKIKKVICGSGFKLYTAIKDN